MGRAALAHAPAQTPGMRWQHPHPQALAETLLGLGALSLVLLLSPASQARGFLGLPAPLVTSAANQLHAAPSLQDLVECIPVLYTGPFDLVVVDCTDPDATFAEAMTTCGEARALLGARTFAGLDATVFLPQATLTHAPGQPSPAAALPQLARHTMHPSLPGYQLAVDSFADESPQERIYVVADALGALRAVLVRQDGGGHEAQDTDPDNAGPDPAPAVPTILKPASSACSDKTGFSVSTTVDSVDLRAAVGILPGLQVMLAGPEQDPAAQSSSNCGFAAEESLTYSTFISAYAANGACQTEDFPGFASPSEVYTGLVLNAHDDADSALPITPSGFEVRRGLAFGLGVSAARLVAHNTRNILTCYQAEDAGLPGIGELAFVVLDCDQLTSADRIAECVFTLRVLSGFADTLPPQAVFVRPVLHPPAGSLGVGQQMALLVKALFGQAIVALVLRPVGYTPEGYIPPGYSLEPAFRAPDSVPAANTANLAALQTALRALSRAYRGNRGLAEPGLHVWLQLSAARDCAAASAPFAPDDSLHVAASCAILSNLVCRFVNGDPVQSNGSACGFDEHRHPAGWTVSHRSMLGAAQDGINCSTDLGIRAATNTASIAFPQPEDVPQAQVLFSGVLAGVLSLAATHEPELAQCLLGDPVPVLGVRIGIVDCREEALSTLLPVCLAGLKRVYNLRIAANETEVDRNPAATLAGGHDSEPEPEPEPNSEAQPAVDDEPEPGRQYAVALVHVDAQTGVRTASATILRLLETTVTAGVFAEFELDPHAAPEANVDRVVSVVIAIAGHLGLHREQAVPLGVVVRDFDECNPGGALYVEDTPLYERLNRYAGLSVFLAQVDGDQAKGNLSGAVCGFTGERLVYPRQVAGAEVAAACGRWLEDNPDHSPPRLVFALGAVPEPVTTVDSVVIGEALGQEEFPVGGPDLLQSLYAVLAIPVVGLGLGTIVGGYACLRQLQARREENRQATSIV